MGLPVEVNNLMLGSLGGYTVGRSLRFRSSASAYLSRTFGTPTSQKKGTISYWFKIGITTPSSFAGNVEVMYGSRNTTTGNNPYIGFANNSLRFNDFDGSAGTGDLVSTAVYRDPSSWYHFVVAIDSTQATSTDRVKMYVNGVQITSFSTANYPSLNRDMLIFASGAQYIGYSTPGNSFIDGYMAELNYIDGQQLTPSSFGAYDTNGVWQPKKYTGTYGTNGFYLPFSNTTSTTTLVQDSSGNGNNWTPNNISLTAGTTYDSMIDSPTNSASSSNYAVMNPLDSLSGTASNGNLLWTAGAAQSDIRGTIAIPSSGKFYMECTVGSTTNASSAASFGLATSTVALNSSNAVSGLYQLYASSSGYLSLNGTNVSSSLGVWTAGDILQIAVDVDNTKMWLGKNNTWYDSSGGSTGNPSTGANATSTTSMVGLFPFSNCYSNNVTWNMGQRPFTYTPPSGYKALNTYNLPAPSIANGAQYMAATLFTGNVSTNTINNGTNTTIGTSFQPDMVWLKSRSNANNHTIYDSIRGINDILYPNLTNAAVNSANNLTSFNSNGYTLGANENSNDNSGESSVGWSWKGGGTGVTNNSGTITSTVSANTTAGFSVVTYTGSGANATVGHGLGVAPSMIIVKQRNNTLAHDWQVYHTSIGATKVVKLNDTNAASTASAVYWNNTAPTSSVFSVGTGGSVNESGKNQLAYCFSAVSGYSAFGSYNGTGSSDGPFVFTNFRPRFVMIKMSSGVEAWLIYDSSRNTYNISNLGLYPNSSSAEVTETNNPIDLLSNGFKLRGTGATTNSSGQTYIWAAFAEAPFNFSRAR